MIKLWQPKLRGSGVWVWLRHAVGTPERNAIAPPASRTAPGRANKAEWEGGEVKSRFSPQGPPWKEPTFS